MIQHVAAIGSEYSHIASKVVESGLHSLHFTSPTSTRLLTMPTPLEEQQAARIAELEQRERTRQAEIAKIKETVKECIKELNEKVNHVWKKLMECMELTKEK
jgi:hypothetical protein